MERLGSESNNSTGLSPFKPEGMENTIRQQGGGISSHYQNSKTSSDLWLTHLIAIYIISYIIFYIYSLIPPNILFGEFRA